MNFYIFKIEYIYKKNDLYLFYLPPVIKFYLNLQEKLKKTLPQGRKQINLLFFIALIPTI